jgi:hypothetical protein
MDISIDAIEWLGQDCTSLPSMKIKFRANIQPLGGVEVFWLSGLTRAIGNIWLAGCYKKAQLSQATDALVDGSFWLSGHIK